jgi:galactonate dehydratase
VSPDSSAIESVEWFVVKVPKAYRFSGDQCDDPFQGSDYYFEDEWDQVYSTNLETLFVRVTTEEGIQGWGEAQAPISPETTAKIIETLLGPMVLGEPISEVERIHEMMYDAMNVRGHYQGFFMDATSALDIAMWDALGRHFDRPVSALFGGRERDSLPAYVSLPGFSTEEKINQAAEFIDAGFTGVKIFGGADVTEDIDTVEKIRSQVGPAPQVMVDAFWSYTPVEARKITRQPQDDISFLEAPLSPEDIRGHRRLVEDSSVPIAVGEPIRSRHEFTWWLERNAMDIVQPDFLRTGLTEGDRIAAIAAENGRAVAPHYGASFGIGMAASWHLASTVDRLLLHEHQPRCFDVTNEFITPELDCSGGRLHVPAGPGIGVSIDERTVDRYVDSRGSLTL